LESVTVARRLHGCQALRMLPRARIRNMDTRYVCLCRTGLGITCNSARWVLIYWPKDLTIYQDGSSDHINQLFKGLGDTMHGKPLSHPVDFNLFTGRVDTNLTRE
jgi:hypothetical protein